MDPSYAERYEQVVLIHPEVLDADGQIVVSPEASEKVRASHPEPTTDADLANLYREAQKQTILDLYESTIR